jgi:hypothetical protein
MFSGTPANAMPDEVTISNDALIVKAQPGDSTFSVQDLRTQKTWVQRKIEVPPESTNNSPTKPTVNQDWLVTFSDAVAAPASRPTQIELTGTYGPSKIPIQCVIALDGNLPEFTVTLTADGDLSQPLDFPPAFVGGKDLIVPMNEGISFPVDDPTIAPLTLQAYAGHGICMAFWGVTDGQDGQMTIIETPDDALIRIDRHDDKLDVSPLWQAQKGLFGYPRRLRYIFFDKGGYVAMTKRYRAYAQKIGLFKTLDQKRTDNPNVDLLIGTANVWCWGIDPIPMVKEMQAAGLNRVMWSNCNAHDDINTLNSLGVLTSRYDNYQDVVDPNIFPLVKYVSEEWRDNVAAWPDDIVLDSKGKWVHGWGITLKDGTKTACGIINDVAAIKYARKDISDDLAIHPYHCRFIDTTTATPWREDYSPVHPMTRSQCRQARVDLLRYVSEDAKLVTGSETGMDAAAGVVDYFEGMMSLAHYRVPDSGREVARIWNTVPKDVAKFQLGQAYRLPLWELVYHDCVVAYWYFGDSSNKLPSLWDKRDLFNVLYGTPPMYVFDRDFWNKNKDRFVQSYQNIIPTVRALGYSEMTDHHYLTADRNVQQTAFANGTTVTVNFGDQPYHFPDNSLLAPLGFRVDNANHPR